MTREGKKSKISTITKVWKTLIPIPVDDFEGFRTSVEEDLRCGEKWQNWD